MTGPPKELRIFRTRRMMVEIIAANDLCGTCRAALRPVSLFASWRNVRIRTSARTPDVAPFDRRGGRGRGSSRERDHGVRRGSRQGLPAVQTGSPGGQRVTVGCHQRVGRKRPPAQSNHRAEHEARSTRNITGIDTERHWYNKPRRGGRPAPSSRPRGGWASRHPPRPRTFELAGRAE